MKSGTSELMKFKRLQRRLDERKRGTVGLLECLWQRVAKDCPEGDVGRYTNEEIAIMADWEGDPDELVRALVECGWLDECDQNRLIVHDWAEHCPNWVKGNLASRSKQFAIARRYSEPPDGGTQVANADGTEQAATFPSLSTPNQSKSKESAPEVSGGEHFEQLIAGWNSLSYVPKVRLPAGKSIVAAWNLGWRKPELREHLRAPESILEMVGRSTYCHGQTWFTFTWLFKREHNGTEQNLIKLMGGQYVDSPNGKGTDRPIAPAW